MGKKPIKYKKFTSENLELINAKKLQEKESQGPSHSKDSASDLGREPQNKKSGSTSRLAPEERNNTDITLPENTNEVKNQIKQSQETSVSEIGQTHHNDDKPHANQQNIVESDDKANSTVDNTVLEPKLPVSVQNASKNLEDLASIPKKEELNIVITSEDQETEVLENTSSMNMEPRKDVQIPKQQPDNPAWINTATCSPPSTKHPFSSLNPNATEFRPGGCFGTTDSPQPNVGYPVEKINGPVSFVHPVIQRDTMNVATHHVMPPGMVLQSTPTSTPFVAQQFPSPFQNNEYLLQRAPANLPVENISSPIQASLPSYSTPVPDNKNSTSPWNVEKIGQHHHPAERNIEKQLQTDQGFPDTTDAHQPAQGSAGLPQPSTHNAFMEPIHGARDVDPKSPTSNLSNEEYFARNYPKSDDRKNNSHFQRNDRDNFHKDNDRTRHFQGGRGGRGGRHLNEDQDDRRGGGRRLNDNREYNRRSERGSVPEKKNEYRLNEDRDENPRENEDREGRKDSRSGGQHLNESRHNEKFRSSEIDKKNESHSNKNWNENPRDNRRNSDDKYQRTERSHDRFERNENYNKHKNLTEGTYDNVRSMPNSHPRRGRDRRPNDSWGKSNAYQNRGYENRDNEPRSHLKPFSKDQNRETLEKNDSSDKHHARQELGDNVESSSAIGNQAGEEQKIHENRNKSETSWRDRGASDNSNREFNRNKNDTDTNRIPRNDYRTRGNFGNSRGRDDVQSRGGSNSYFGRGARGRGRDPGQGRYNSNRRYQNEKEVRRSPIEAIEITNDDSSKDSSDNYHITDENSSDVPEKSVELVTESLRGTSDVSHDSDVVWDDWNYSVDSAVEPAVEESDWDTPYQVEVEKPKPHSSVENISKEEDEEETEEEVSNIPKRKVDIPVVEQDKIQGTSKNSSYGNKEKRESEKPRRSYEMAKGKDPRMERERLNRSMDSASLGSDGSAGSSIRSSDPRLKQTRITSYTSGQDTEKENSDKEFDCWEMAWEKITEFHVVQEIQGNLFEQPKDFSLAHCVAEDLRMGSGIAVDFKREFKNVDVLLDQRVRQGGLATIHDEKTNRFVYYLVTKRESTGKPTYLTLWKSLNKMRSHVKENEVKKLAIPRLACGLDRLEWNKVKSMIEYVFKDIDVDIRVCNFQQDEELSKKTWSTCKLVVEDTTHITKIGPGTLIFYFTTENGHVDENMHEISKKFNFLMNFKSHKSKNLGELVYSEDKRCGLCGCVVRKTAQDKISFKSLLQCIREFNKMNKKFGKESFDYVAYQWVKETDYSDDLINQKIITLLTNFLTGVDVYVCRGAFDDNGE